MEKFIKWCGTIAAGLLLTLGVVGTLVTPVMASEAEAGVPVVTSENPEKTTIPPTFVGEVDEQNDALRLWMGKNLLVFGNNLTHSVDTPAGFTMIAGNNLNLTSKSEYSFVAGNVVNYSGQTSRDFYAAGSIVTLARGANIGRNVFVAAASVTVESNLVGDLAATADTVEIKDVTIAGNVNLSAANIKFTGNVKIAGALTYNEDANVSGLEKTTYGSLEVYEVVKADPAALFIAAVYGKIFSIASLFLVMALLCAIYPKLHQKIGAEASVNRFGIDLAFGFGTLLIVPVIAVLTFFTFVVAPIGILALAVYFIMIYLSQGFAGVWLGHLIMEKGFKSQKSNVFVEALIGITILGLVSLIPYLGQIVGFLSLLLGLGLILCCIKPTKASKSITKEA